MFLLSKFAIKKRTGWVTGDATDGQSSLIPELVIVNINMSGGAMDLSAVFFHHQKELPDQSTSDSH